MSPFSQHGWAWAEWNGGFVKVTTQADGVPTHTRVPFWKATGHDRGTLTIFTPDWQHSREIKTRELYSQWSPNGHNWYCATRVDFYFWNSMEPYRWWGRLITGGYNVTFRVKRCVTQYKDPAVHVIWGLPENQHISSRPASITAETHHGLTFWRYALRNGQELWARCDHEDTWRFAISPEKWIATQAARRLQIPLPKTA